jgi:signal transduction histidine kinase/DNA-binding response OmpR family regulator
MSDSLLIVGGPLAGPARDAPWHASATKVSADTLALLLADPATPVPAVAVIGADVTVSLALVRSLRAAWPACELVFIAAAGQDDDLRKLLRRSVTLGGHWTILAAHDPKLVATIDSALHNAARRVKLRTTLARANVAIAAPREVDESQYRRMAQASHYLDQVLAQSRDGFVGLDAALRLLQWNDSAARQWQVPQRQALALTGPELPFWSGRLAHAVALALRGADTAPFEQGDDAGRHFEYGVSSVRDADARLIGVSLVIRDVTEQKQRQDGLLMQQAELEALVARRTADLQTANAALQQSQKLEAIGRLTGGVAHDFNNILQVIGSNLDLMGLDPAITPTLRQRLAGSTAAVERAARLSAQLLAFARRQPLQPVPTNLTTTLRGMDDLLRRALGEAVDVDIAIAQALWNTLIDRHQLENVILNLAINARDAMGGNGHLTIELSNVELDQRYVDGRADLAPGQYILLAVSDTGTGIPADVLERVFEPFYTTKAEGEGTGLGLSMAYGFVKQSGGHIAIYSEPGHGTTVRIYLPRSLEAEHAMTPLATDAIPSGTETILVVEDDAAVRIAVVDMLKGLGYAVLSAYDAASALAMLESGAAPDLLFTDVVMPGPLRSPELARQARLLVPGIGVLFTSGYTQNAIVHAGRLDTGVELLSKPYRRGDLARKVRSMLDVRMAPDTTPQRIVLVEDNDDARDMLKELLEVLGYEALCFATAEKALPHLRASDVLLTDLTLPGMSGIELAERAVAQWPGLPVIFASGRLVEGTSVRARILTKPYSLEQLQAVLDEVSADIAQR